MKSQDITHAAIVSLFKYMESIANSNMFKMVKNTLPVMLMEPPKVAGKM